MDVVKAVKDRLADLFRGPPYDSIYTAAELSKKVKWLASARSNELRIHCNQCQYLSTKLSEAVQDIEEYKRGHSAEDIQSHRGIFKQLCRVAIDVTKLVMHCCNDEWIQSALILSDVSEQVITQVTDLRLCVMLLKNGSELETLARVTDVGYRKTERQVIEGKAKLDREWLLSKLTDHVRSSQENRQQRNPERDLMTNILLQKLQIGSFQVTGLQINHVTMTFLERGTQLGSGGAGTVFKTSWCGIDVAEKSLRIQGIPDKEFDNEVQILAGLGHPHIVTFYFSATIGQGCSLILELMDHRNLSTYMFNESLGGERPPFDMATAVDVMTQIADAMDYLHRKKIVHRDLKATNILIKLGKWAVSDGAPGDKRLLVKLADFGISTQRERTFTNTKQEPNIGTTRWMAPELMPIESTDGLKDQILPRAGTGGSKDQSLLEQNSSPHSDTTLVNPFKVDIYSFGMVCIEVLTGNVPLPKVVPKDFRKKIQNNERPEIPTDCPEALATLIKNCWKATPESRPSFADVCVELRHIQCSLLIGMSKAALDETTGLPSIVPVFTKKTTSHKRRKKATKYHVAYGKRKIINKTDFEIRISDYSATVGFTRLRKQGLEGDFVEFWADSNATYRQISIHSVEGNLVLSSDDFYDDVSPIIEIHYEAKEKELFFVFSSEDTASGDGDNDESGERGNKKYVIAFLVCILAWLTFITTRSVI